MGKTFRLSIVIALAVSAGYAENWENYDLAPGAVPGTSHPSDEQWDWLYAWPDMEAQSGDNGMLGICFDGTNLWVSGRGVTEDNMFYLFEPETGDMVDSFLTGTTSAWGVRDMCYDGIYIYGGEDGGLHQYDVQTHEMVGTIPTPDSMAFQRANAYDPATDHFYCGNFGSDCYEQDREGNLIRSWSPAPLTAVYGMAWDMDAPDGPWLWVHDQTTPVSGCNVHQLDPVTLTYTGFYVTLVWPPGLNMAGGLDYCDGIDPVFTTMLVMGQGTPDAGASFEMYLGNIPPPLQLVEFMVNNNGPDLAASLSWINPGGSTSDLDGVLIYRNGVQIADLTDVQIGQPYSWDDENVPSAGMYNYEGLPYSNIFPGLPASQGVWVGLDVPGAPDYFELFPDPGGALEILCVWSNPTEGMHGGYFAGVDGFNLYRSYEGGFFEPIASVIQDTSYIDYIMMPGDYEYAVAGINQSGEGEWAYANTIGFGPPEFEEIPYDWVEIRDIGTNTGITGDDQNLGPFEMGMAFIWYDYNVYSSIRVCSNGFLSFTSTSIDYTNNPIPDTPEPNNLIAPYWDDFYLPDGGNIWYYQDTANGRFIVEWDDINHLSGEDGYYFEAIFYPDGTIEFMYQHIGDVLNSCTVGVENAAGTVGVQTTYNGSGPLEPENEMGIRIFPVGTTCPPFPSITLTPYGTPIQIPAGGGTFEFNISIISPELPTNNADIWTNVTLPDGSFYGPIINVQDFDMQPNVYYERDRVQAVPTQAPAGTYTYNGYLGVYPSIIWEEDQFSFEKLATGDGEFVEDWYCWGEAFPGEVIETADLVPDKTELLMPYPNPFNSQLAVSFTLNQNSEMKLKVYDVLGREVQSLVTGHLSPGYHEAVWDADGVGSGVYFIQLTVNGKQLTDVKKVMLVK